MSTAPFPTVFLVYPDGAHIAMAMPGIPRAGDTVSARWGTNPEPTLYRVSRVVWDLNTTRVLAHLTPAATA
jgi:hypothetical protein